MELNKLELALNLEGKIIAREKTKIFNDEEIF